MSRSRASWFTILPAVAAAVTAAPVFATVYLTVEQAQSAMFPHHSLTPAFRQLQPDQIAAIRKASGVAPLSRDLRAWKAQDGGWFIVDRVVGKHEFITYAVALTRDGAMRSVDILEYRETYGGEVRNAAWRQQFVGKRFGAPLQIGKDIRNISGATLSSRHVTDGVRRLVATWQVVLKNA